jgi:hypothetical protein
MWVDLVTSQKALPPNIILEVQILYINLGLGHKPSDLRRWVRLGQMEK